MVQFRQQQLSDLQEVRDRLDVEAQQEKRVKQKLTVCDVPRSKLYVGLCMAVWLYSTFTVCVCMCI